MIFSFVFYGFTFSDSHRLREREVFLNSSQHAARDVND